MTEHARFIGHLFITSQAAINTSRKIEHLMNINRCESVRSFVSGEIISIFIRISRYSYISFFIMYKILKFFCIISYTIYLMNIYLSLFYVYITARKFILLYIILILFSIYLFFCSIFCSNIFLIYYST